RIAGEPSLSLRALRLHEHLDALFDRRRWSARYALDAGRAVDAIDARTDVDRPSVAAMARHLGVSTRTLRRLFLDDAGLPARAFVSLQRFALALRGIAGARPLARVAADAGFFDQAHMNREVRRYAGVAPSALRAELRASTVVRPGVWNAFAARPVTSA